MFRGKIQSDLENIIAQLNITVCAFHPLNKAASVCLFENCWKISYERAFLCAQCTLDHIKLHKIEDLVISTSSAFTNDLFDEIEEYQAYYIPKITQEANIMDMLSKINGISDDLEKWVRVQMNQVVMNVENFMKLNFKAGEKFEILDKLKQKTLETKERLTNESSINVKKYCYKIKELTDYVNGTFKYSKFEKILFNEIDQKNLVINLQKMQNDIKSYIKQEVESIKVRLENIQKEKANFVNKNIISSKSINLAFCDWR